ncbi:Carnitine O-acetyltransferase mitochondrial [Coemansia javaensis]|uniref:Carnitine O-acetyltransferase mitochondrial n=1 Tax=Coemansia javaensis TaxID=2761396 RepID=A0A9W8HPK7_9FUNG|nr:Carnitine O-acetyltransferase mitochondrial [Coemansia javaensis]
MALPNLPIPELDDTAARFAAAVRPLFGAGEVDACLAKLRDFVAGPGPALQARLRERSATHDNWLEEWWNDHAYFANRASVCFNVNYFFGFRATPAPVRQARLAAVLIESALRFRAQLDAGALEPDSIRGQRMCMHQYRYMFATCRHPGAERDWTETYARADSGHVVVAHGGRFYALRPPPAAAAARRSRDAIAHIESQIQAILDAEPLDRARSVGVLTAAPRDSWHAARESLLAAAPENARSLRTLESAAFVVSLEPTAPATADELARACYCGDGTNRYFDKNFQILVFANGRYGFNGEHSLTDATTDMRLCGALVRDAEAEAEAEATEEAPPLPLPPLEPGEARPAEELAFVYSAELLGHIGRAVEYFDATLAARELATLAFDGFGKDQIKALKVSPDAFVQMAMQLAYYRQFRRVPPTYESASTKAFARGRTETSRSVSDHSVAWCRAMVDRPEATTLLDKAELLQRAVAHQAQFTAQCAKGGGIDRHLLGLERALRPGEPAPALFSDPVFTGSRHWRLSTSQISDPILAAYGWGEVVDDGFGVAYRIEGAALHFNVVSQRLGSRRLCQYLADALMDMRLLLSSAHKQPHEIAAEVDAVATMLSSIRLLSSSPRLPPSPPSLRASPSKDPGSDSAAMGEPPTRLPASDVICALEARLSRFVKESLHWALPSAL